MGKLAKKLILIFTVISIVPLLILSVINYSVSTNALKNEYISANEKLIFQSGENLTKLIDELISITSECYYDRDFMKNPKMNTSDVETWRHNCDFFRSMLVINPEIMRIRYYVSGTDEVLSFTNRATMNNKDDDKSLAVVEAVQKTNKGYYIGQGSINKGQLMFGRNIVDFARQESFGTIVTSVSLKKYDEICKNACNDNEESFIINTDGQLICAGNSLTNTEAFTNVLLNLDEETRQNDGYLISEINQKEYLILYRKVLDSLFFIKTVPMNDIIKSSSQAVMISLIIVGVIVLVIALLAIFFSLRITRPLQRLLDSAKKVASGDYSVDLESYSDDEVGELSDQFNNLSTKLDELVNKNLRTELAESRAKLDALQLQMNPHFLYNSLQSIGTMALKNDGRSVYKAIIKLSELMRYNYSSVGIMVTLRTEIDKINSYIEIQQLRFSNEIHIDMDIDPDTEECLLPKLILQPIVENSIIHGIDNTGIVRISSKLINDKLRIEVFDSGGGISREKLEEIKSDLKNQNAMDKKGHIGLINTCRRMELLYKEEARFDVDSEEGEYFRITMEIPAVFEEEKNA